MRTGKNMSKRIVKLLIAVSVCMLLTGCVNTGAHIVPSVTMPPESTQPPRTYPKPYAGAGSGGGNGGSQQRIR